MCMVRALSLIVFLSVFTAISFFLFVRSASADGVTVTIDTTSLTIVEGDSFTLNSTVTNNSGSVISLLGVGSGSGYLGGDTDQTDGPFEFGLVSGGCVTGFVTSPKFGEKFPTLLPTLNPGSSCVLFMIVTAPSHPDLIPEDKDSGVWDVNTGVAYTCDGCGDFVDVNSPDKIVTVEDQPSSSVPEPSVLLLLATGLLWVSAAARRNLLSA